MEAELNRALSDAVLRRLAGEQTYRKGADYFQHGHVESIEAQDDTVRATVRGKQRYTVTLESDEGVVDYACDCPRGEDGAFCKHCVAAALAWLNRDHSKPKTRRAKQTRLADAAKVLQQEEKETLVRMIVEWAGQDRNLRERVVQYAARRLGPESAAAAAKVAFDRAARIRGFLQYRQASAWARGVMDAIDNFERLLQDGQPAAVIEICEHALERIARACEGIDDSDGHLSMLRDRLEELHFRACQEARPDPVALAGRLFRLQLSEELDIFYDAVQQYAEILGPEGLEEYRRLANAEWRKVPVRTKESPSQWGKEAHITAIMESLARASGATDELIAVLSRDLSSPYQYFQIAETCANAGRHEEALQWGEKGLKAFPDLPDVRLREFVAEKYHRRGRHEDAMKLIWTEFSGSPHLETYRKLERHAKEAGNWPEWRSRALDEIRRRIAKAKAEARTPMKRFWMRSEADHSRIVQIYLYERDIDAAWREAQEGGCSDGLWLELAAKREKEHPEDAAPIYLKQAETALNLARNGCYEEAVELLAKAAAAMKRMDKSAEFVRTLDALRLRHKAKRNFIKLIEQQRKSLYLS